MKSITKDILKTIIKERKRFLSMTIIAILGISMFSGLQAGCDDLRITADHFFDEQNLHDVYIQSTLGLTQDDVEALRSVDGITQVSGFYTEEVQTVVDSINKTILLKVLDPEGMNQPYLLEGSMPVSADEIIVTEKYMNETGKALGDTLYFTEMDLEDDKEDSTMSEDEAEADEVPDENDEFSIDTSGYEIEEDEETPTFPNTCFTIVGIVIDPTDINASEGTTSFRSTATTDYTCYVLPEAADSDIYTGIGVTITGLKDSYCFDSSYDLTVREVTNRIADNIKTLREEARTQDIKDQASQTIDDVEKDMYDAFEEADQKFQDAWDEIEEGLKELEDAQAELDDGLKKGEKEIAEGKRKINDGYDQLAASEKKIAASEEELKEGEKELEKNEKLLASKEKELENGEKQLKDAKDQLAAGEKQIAEAKAQIAEGQQQVDAAMTQIEDAEAHIAAGQAEISAQEAALAEQQSAFEAGKDQMDPEEAAAMEAQLSAAKEQLSAAREELEASAAQTSAARTELEAKAQELAAGKEELDKEEANLSAAKKEIKEKEALMKSGRKELNAAKKQLQAARKTLEDGKKKLQQGKEEIRKGKKTLDENMAKLKKEEARMYDSIDDGQDKIDDGRKELEEGIEEYNSNKIKYLNQRADAEAKIADARQEVIDLEGATWYIQNRCSLSGYNNVKNDMSAIESLGTVFAFVFLIIAVLICLTTVTRMVEEDRGLIGTYQALGYYSREIRRKYMTFALASCLLGCLIGEFVAFYAFPSFLGYIFGTMYQLPGIQLAVNWGYFIAGPAVFLISIGTAVYLTSRQELNQYPATLMRPRAPKAGSRVFLEFIPFIWKRLSFLNKVTARNIFRYKKRFFMTILGISGCTAILLAGFGIKDTVVDLMSRQYEEISRYSWMGLVSADDQELLEADLDSEESVVSYMSLQIQSVSLINDNGEALIIPMYILPDGADLTDYVKLQDIKSGQEAQMTDQGILVTRNASTMLNFDVGDQLTIQNPEFYTREFTISGIVENYLGNNIFLTQSLYESTFGGFEENACLAILDEKGQTFIDQEAEKEMILSSVSTQKLKSEFSTSFALINMVVYLIIIMAAALAFVVLFTLSTTNISERERELATIKVLGFYNREVHLYVNKETIILTIIGILVGLPVGVLMLQTLTDLLKMPELYFAASIHQISYLIASVLAFAFALIVNQMTNRSLNKIDPVEALKSIE